MMTIAERTVIGSAIEEACELLPDGWWIEIHLEHDGGGVELYDPEGERREFPTNYERMSDEIRDAIEYAAACENKSVPNREVHPQT